MTSIPTTKATKDPTDAPVMLVTGGAKRIGAAIVSAAHDHGYRVIIHCHRSKSQAYALARSLNAKRGCSSRVITADLDVVNSEVALGEVVDEVMGCFGRLDVLVHNASRFYPTAIGTTTLRDWEALLLTNAKAPLFLSQALTPYLAAQQGSIVSLLDIHAHNKPFKQYTVYSMAKAAHQMMVQSLALELAPSIRVNGIAPGVNILPEASSDQALDPQRQQRIIESIPLQRVGTPHDIADAVLFLAHAHYITGQIIAIDGGRGLTLAGDVYHQVC